MIELYQMFMRNQINNINHNYTLTNIQNAQLGPIQIKYPSKNQLNDPEFQIGGQENNGQKQGIWCEIDRRGMNYLLLFKGEYVNNQKHGKWIYYIMNFLNDKIEAVGFKKYHQNELLGLQEYPIIYESINSITILKQMSYNYKGNRVFQSFISQYDIFLECGYYDKESKKQGQWTELLQDYVGVSSDFIYFICEKGEYVDGKKYGIWKQYFYQYQMEPSYSTQSKANQFKNPSLISEGKYYNDLKFGKWIEPCYYDIENMIDESLVGKYINNNQTEEWKLKEEKDDQKFQGQFQNGLKFGQWFEFKSYRNFLSSSADELIIQENGKYVKGKRSGEWVQQVEDRIAKHSYDDEGDINSKFKIFQIVGQKKFYLVKIIGEYRNKMKSGFWTTLIQHNQEYIICEQGIYQNRIKQGEWIESQLFEIDSEQGTFNFLLMQKGEYNQKGYKIGEWIWEIKNLGDENMNECEMYKLQGKLNFNPDDDSIIGNFIVFGDKFDNFNARLGFFEVFTGTITNGLRDKEWKFADLSQLTLEQSVFTQVSEEVDEIIEIQEEEVQPEFENEGIQQEEQEEHGDGQQVQIEQEDQGSQQARSEGHADGEVAQPQEQNEEQQERSVDHGGEAQQQSEGAQERASENSQQEGVQNEVNSNENSQHGEDDAQNYPNNDELFAQYNQGVLI